MAAGSCPSSNCGLTVRLPSTRRGSPRGSRCSLTAAPCCLDTDQEVRTHLDCRGTSCGSNATLLHLYCRRTSRKRDCIPFVSLLQALPTASLLQADFTKALLHPYCIFIAGPSYCISVAGAPLLQKSTTAFYCFDIPFRITRSVCARSLLF